MIKKINYYAMENDDIYRELNDDNYTGDIFFIYTKVK